MGKYVGMGSLFDKRKFCIPEYVTLSIVKGKQFHQSESQKLNIKILSEKKKLRLYNPNNVLLSMSLENAFFFQVQPGKLSIGHKNLLIAGELEL